MSTQSFQFRVRCMNTDCRGDWAVPFALTEIKGIGIRLARIICDTAEIEQDALMGFLTDEEVQKIEDIIRSPKEYKIPSFLVNRRKDIETGEDIHISSIDMPVYLKDDLDRLQKINCYRGIRHKLGLRVRGQRTRTSGRGGQTIGVAKKKSRG
jgi:ribosomal protein S13